MFYYSFHEYFNSNLIFVPNEVQKLHALQNQRLLATNQSQIFSSNLDKSSEENSIIESTLNSVTQNTVLESHKLWYFPIRKDLVTTVNVSALPLFHKEDPLDDRIVNQLLYIPPNYNKNVEIDKYKKIFLDDGPGAFYKVKLGE